MAKEHITQSDLFVQLDREFRKRTSGRCERCYVSLPFRVDRADKGGPNWDVAPVGECPNGCQRVLDDLVASLQKKFRLAA